MTHFASFSIFHGKSYNLPSVLWHCWFGVRNSIEWWGAFCMSLSGARYNLQMVQLTTLPPQHLLFR